jgi:hypothetical protein
MQERTLTVSALDALAASYLAALAANTHDAIWIEYRRRRTCLRCARCGAVFADVSAMLREPHCDGAAAC